MSGPSDSEDPTCTPTLSQPSSSSTEGAQKLHGRLYRNRVVDQESWVELVEAERAALTSFCRQERDRLYQEYLQQSEHDESKDLLDANKLAHWELGSGLWHMVLDEQVRIQARYQKARWDKLCDLDLLAGKCFLWWADAQPDGSPSRLELALAPCWDQRARGAWVD